MSHFKRSLGVTVPVALAFGLLTATPAQAVPTVTVGTTDYGAGVTTNMNVTLSGFDTGQNYQATVKFVNTATNVEVSNGTLTATQGSTSLIAGYTSYSGAKLGFTGTYPAVAATLASMTWTPAAASGDISVRIGLSSAPGANQFYDANSGHYYEFVSTGTNWTAARAAAESKTLYGLQGYLAMITTEAENNFVSSETSATNIWIGGTDAAVEGTWRWQGATGASVPTETGTLMSAWFQGWVPPEPNDWGTGEDCVVTNWSGTRGAWNDLDCAGSHSYLIEYGGRPGETSTAEASTTTPTVTAKQGVTLGVLNADVSCTFASDCPATIALTDPTTGGVAGTFAYATSNASTAAVAAGAGGATVTLGDVGSATVTATFTPTDTATYAPVDTSFTISIAQGTLTVTAVDKTVTTSTSTGTTYSAAGLASGDALSAVTFTYDDGGAYSSTTPPTSIGAYTVTPSAATFSSGSASNYSITYVAGAYQVNATPPSPNPGPTTSEPSPSATASTTPSPDPTPEPPDPVIELAPENVNPNVPLGSPLSNGQVIVAEDGSPSAVNVSFVRTGDGRWPQSLGIQVSGFTLGLASVDANGALLPLDGNKTLVLESKTVKPRKASKNGPSTARLPKVRIWGSGFRPGSDVRVFILPNWYLGAVGVDATGSFSGDLPVPMGMPTGSYTLQANGYLADGSVGSVSAGVMIVGGRVGRSVLRSSKVHVWFAPWSSELTRKSKKELSKIARKYGDRTYSISIDGYVQRNWTTANDASLSLARAREVSRYLRDKEVLGKVTARGKGRAPQRGPKARRVTLIIRYYR